MENQGKNLILATALSFLVILGWFMIFPPEEMPPQDPSTTTQPQDTALPPGPVTDFAATPPAASVSDSSGASLADTAAQAVLESERIEIRTPNLVGSISLLGGRVDDLSLTQYRETVDDDSGIVRLLAPAGTAKPYYALFGWAPAGQLKFSDIPGATTPWRVETGTVLSPGNPVTLVWENGKGHVFRRTMAIDDGYMFTITQSVTNRSDNSMRMAPYGVIARHGEPDVQGFFILHEGVIQMADGQLAETDYDDVPDLPFDTRENGNFEATQVLQNGWVGFTDKYWMMTIVPMPGEGFTAVSKYSERSDIYQAEARLPTILVEPNSEVSVSTMLFAGAKEWEQISRYESDLGIERFVDSIDWGWFFFLTKPIFILLHWINQQVGNMGWSIICLTFVIKAVLFPLAYKSYVSMARMKELQPEMEKIRKTVGDDKKLMQQKVMELYRKSKVNPAAGCWPILPQIPIFFSLYKVIFVTIEMRHARFALWINDLSAPDPTSILNLFGALPWGAPDPSSLLSIISLGVLPILLGVTMWLQQKLNPAPTDPTQAMIFAWMPWIFMFMLGQFASGLIIYWIANNTITFAQQYVIMRTQGVRPDVLGNIVTSLRKIVPDKKDDEPPKEQPKEDIDKMPSPSKGKKKKRKKKSRS